MLVVLAVLLRPPRRPPLPLVRAADVPTEEAAAANSKSTPEPPVAFMGSVSAAAASTAALACVLDAIPSAKKWREILGFPIYLNHAEHDQHFAGGDFIWQGRPARKTKTIASKTKSISHQSSFEEEGTKTRERITSPIPRSAPNTDSQSP